MRSATLSSLRVLKKKEKKKEKRKETIHTDTNKGDPASIELAHSTVFPKGSATQLPGK
jgi:hypothetical protein